MIGLNKGEYKMTIYLEPIDLLDKIKSHLFPKGNEDEQALFLFATFDSDNDSLKVIDHLFLSGDDFNIQSRWHIELKDEIRSQLIKKAHDLNASIIEVHSHVDQKIARFSESDFYGFEEFVPHILWRLRNRPYVALVFTENNFDALIWFKKDDDPKSISSIKAADIYYYPTNKSISRYEG